MERSMSPRLDTSKQLNYSTTSVVVNIIVAQCIFNCNYSSYNTYNIHK